MLLKVVKCDFSSRGYPPWCADGTVVQIMELRACLLRCPS